MITNILFNLIVLVLSIIAIIVFFVYELPLPIKILLALIVPWLIGWLLLAMFKIIAKSTIQFLPNKLFAKLFSGTYQAIASEAYLKNNFAKAKIYFEAGCKINNPDAYYALAYLYHSGKGVKQDHEKAKMLYEKTITKKEIPDAYNNLGILYELGQGVEQSYSTAADYYQKACTLEYAESFNNLGRFYEHGLAFSKDIDKARELYKKSCELGDDEACTALSLLKDKTR